jgi:hypothetical protein
MRFLSEGAATLGKARRCESCVDPCTMQLSNRWRHEVSLDEVEWIVI